MEQKYDCTEDIRNHIKLVRLYLTNVVEQLLYRGDCHDESKLQEPEKSMFDEWTPKLKEYTVESDEYKEALKQMGIGLKHHYENNRHHPEHFEFGVNGMTLVDLIEMFCDWRAAAEKRGVPLNLRYMCDRFDIPDMLMNIFENTLKEG